MSLECSDTAHKIIEASFNALERSDAWYHSSRSINAVDVVMLVVQLR
jgi:hypothetical protein